MTTQKNFSTTQSESVPLGSLGTGDFFLGDGGEMFIVTDGPTVDSDHAIAVSLATGSGFNTSKLTTVTKVSSVSIGAVL